MPATTDRAMRATTEDLYRRYGVKPVSGGQQTEAELAEAKAKADVDAAAKAEQEELDKLKLDDAGREAIRKERDARKAEAKRAKDAETELATLRAKEAEREAAAKKAAEDEAKAKGEFEKLATERGDTITALSGERDTLKSSVEKYDAAIAPLVTALEGELPAEGKEGYDDKAPALDRLTWLTERKALLTKLGVLAQDGSGQKPRQFPPTTPRSTGETLNGQEAEVERARASGKYAPI